MYARFFSAYGTLTWVRANIVQQARTVLMRSVTIAIRYCAIRRQFADRDAPKYNEQGKAIETQVLDCTCRRLGSMLVPFSVTDARLLFCRHYGPVPLVADPRPGVRIPLHW